MENKCVTVSLKWWFKAIRFCDEKYSVTQYLLVLHWLLNDKITPLGLTYIKYLQKVWLGPSSTAKKMHNLNWL